MPDDAESNRVADQVNHQPADGQQEQRANEARRPRRADQPQLDLYKLTDLIWLLTGILEGLIGIRILLKLIAANPAAGFAQFIYSITGFFLTPFVGLTATPSAGGSVLELSSIIAMMVYALIAWIVVRVLWLAFTA